MNIVRPQMSRRNLLTTAALGIPAMGLLGAANLIGATPASAAASGRDFLQTAEAKAGCPYIWGDAGPSSFDCSGLVQWSLAQLGISFPRVSGDQYNACNPISLEQAWATPGAILWFNGHIGISCGDNNTSFEARDETVPVGYFNTDPGWTNGGLVPGLDYSGGGSQQPPSGSVTVDGYWGTATTRRLQEVLGTPTDGVVSSQAVSWQAKNPGLTSGWDWVSDSLATGSTVIEALQQRLGVTADGLIGTNTIMALQGHCGTPQDGYFSGGSTCIMELQKKLNNGAL